MERVACDFCGENSATLEHTLHDLLLGTAGEFQLVRCNRCGLLYLNPRPTREELQRHYPDNYHPFDHAVGSNPSLFVRWARRYGILRRCRAVIRKRHEGRLLDVGCATGVFLDEMRRQGNWEVYGVEPAALAASYAREHFGLQVFQGTLLDAGYPDDFFDVVTMWDVLEHVPNPRGYLDEIRRILKPGGWLIIKVPDPCSWEARLFGPYWIGYDAPRHLFGFPRHVLSRELASLGFCLKEMQCLGSGFFTFVASLGFWLRAQGWIRLGNQVRYLAGSTMARVFMAPFFVVTRQFGLCSSVTYFARKQMSGGAV